MLGTKGGRDADIVQLRQGVETVLELMGDRGRMRDERDPLAPQRCPQFAINQQPFDTQHHSALTPSNSRDRVAAA